MKWFTTDRIIMLGIIVTLAVLLLNIDACRNRKFSQQQGKIDSLTLANQRLVQDTNKLGQIITRQEVILTDNQEDLKKMTEEKFALVSKDQKRVKQINALLQMKTKTEIKEVFVPFNEDWEWDGFDSTDNPCPEHMVATPKELTVDSLQNPDFQFSATLQKDGLQLHSVSFPDSQRIAIVETKGGLFKRDISGKVKLYRRPTLEVQVVHTNPYIKLEGMSSVIYQPKIKGRWLERAIILGAGIFLGSRLTR